MSRHRLPHPNTLTPEQREEYRLAAVGFPAAIRHDVGAGDGSAYYLGQRAADRFYVAAFKGRSLRPAFRFSFTTPAHRDNYVEQWAEKVREWAAVKRKRREPHSLKVGDVLYTNWGWEQTNVEFFEVVAVRGAVVDLRELKQARSEEAIGMQGSCSPILGTYKNDACVKGKRPTADNTVRVDRCRDAWLWDGRAKSWSSYA